MRNIKHITLLPNEENPRIALEDFNGLYNTRGDKLYNSKCLLCGKVFPPVTLKEVKSYINSKSCAFHNPEYCVGKMVGKLLILSWNGYKPTGYGNKRRSLYTAKCTKCNKIFTRYSMNTLRAIGSKETCDGHKPFEPFYLPRDSETKTILVHTKLDIKYRQMRLYSATCLRCGTDFLAKTITDLIDKSKSLTCKRHDGSGNIWSHPRIKVRYHNMIRRCTNPKDKAYPRYGGRGIMIDEEFITDGDEGKRRFNKFVVETCPDPEYKLEMDRIDPNGNYTRSNIQWIPKEENIQRISIANHFRVIYTDGSIEDGTFSDWSKKFGHMYNYLSRNIRKYDEAKFILSFESEVRKHLPDNMDILLSIHYMGDYNISVKDKRCLVYMNGRRINNFEADKILNQFD